jgi:serine/threonine protein kinase
MFKYIPREELIDLENEEFYRFSHAIPELIKKMLEVNPKKRYSAKDIMNNTWVYSNYKRYRQK